MSADDRSIELAPTASDSKRALWQAFSGGVRDNVVAEFAAQGLRFCGLVILARALSPTDFGVFRVLLVLGTLATLVTGVGLPDALVQRKEITPEQESTVWWLSLLLSAVSAAALYVTAPLIASMMAMPGLIVGLRLICLPVLLEGTAVTANARMRHQLRFRALAIADVVSEVVFLGSALSMVALGLSGLSLAVGLAGRYAAHAFSIWIADAHLPSTWPTLAAFRDLGRFALGVSGANASVFLSDNFNFFLIGRLLGSSALGYYSIAIDLLTFVPDRLHKVAIRVLVPTFSHLQSEEQELTRAYVQLFNYLSRLVLPVVACLAMAAPELLGGVYGPQWVPAAGPIRVLAAGLALAGLREGIGAVYYAKDYPSYDTYVHIVRLVLTVIAVVTLAPMGLLAVCIGVSAIEAAVSILGEYLACLLVELRLVDLVRSALPGLRVACLCLLATLGGKAIATLAGLEAPLALGPLAILPAVAFLLLEGSELRRIGALAFDRNLPRIVEA